LIFPSCFRIFQILISTFKEIVVPGGDHAFVFGESVIWNKEINGIKNYLSIAIFGAPSAPEGKRRHWTRSIGS